MGVYNTTTIDNGATATGQSVDSGEPSSVFNLNVGLNTFHVCTVRDGNYTFTVNRSAPDINYAAGGVVIYPQAFFGPPPAVVRHARASAVEYRSVVRNCRAPPHNR